MTLCDALNPRGGWWGEDGDILFAAENRAVLSRVSSSGGASRAITQFDAKKSEVTHRLPQLLPGGEAFLFTASNDNNNYTAATVEVQSVHTNQRKTLLEGATFGRYVASGHLVYLHDGTLFAAPMDVKRLELTGAGSPVLENVSSFPSRGYADLAFAASGTAMYIPGASSNSSRRSLFWLDSSGALQNLNAEPSNYSNPQVSPDGTHIGLLSADGSGAANVAVFEPGARRMTRLTFLKTAVQNFVWAPDNKHLVFRSTSRELSGPGIYWLRADGAGEPQRILEGSDFLPTSFSPDGKRLAYYSSNSIFILPLDLTDAEHPKPGKPELFLRSDTPVRAVAFSPDGRWLAYSGLESGVEVYVRPFPGPGGKWQVSNGGSGQVFWSHDEKKLFLEGGGGIKVVDYKVQGDSFVAGQPHAWLQKPLRGTAGMDLASDGKRFVVAMDADAGEQKPSTHAVVLFNFFDELGRRVPTGK